MGLTIAAAQSGSKPGDVAHNVAHHLAVARIAAGRGVQLLVFPELSLTGYELSLARSAAVEPNSVILAPLRDFASESGMTIVAGAPVPNGDGDLHIGALRFHPDRSVSLYTKVHVHESEFVSFVPGTGGDPLFIEGQTVSLAICRDASFPEHAASAAGLGATIYAAGVMIDEAGYPRKSALMREYARMHRMAALLANYSGVTGGETSAGGSAIWDETGEPIALCGKGEALVIASGSRGCWMGDVVAL